MPLGCARRSHRADQRRSDPGDEDGRTAPQDPPRPSEAEDAGVVRPEDRDRVAGHAGDADLRQADHAAAVAGEHHQGQRDHAEGQRVAADLRQGRSRTRRPGTAAAPPPARGGRRRSRRPRCRPAKPVRTPGGPASSRLPRDALRPDGEGDDHDDEGEHDAVGREVDEADHRSARPIRSAPMAAPVIEPMPPTMTTTSEARQAAHVLAGGDRQRRAADDAGEAREPGADGEDDGEHRVHGDARGRRHSPGRRRRRGSSCRRGYGSAPATARCRLTDLATASTTSR